MIITYIYIGKSTPVVNQSLRMVVNSAAPQRRIISSVHDEHHLGFNRTVEMICNKYYRPNMTNIIKSYVSRLQFCSELLSIAILIILGPEL